MGSSCSQESLVLSDHSPVYSSVSAGGNRRSPSREIGGSTGDRSRSRALPVYLPLEVEILVKSVAVPVLCLRGPVAGLASRAFTPWTVRGRVDENALTVIRHAPPLSMCGLDAPGCSLLTATGTTECARALRATVRSHDSCTCIRLAVARHGVTVRGHTGLATGHVTVAGLMTARGLGRGVGGLDGVAWIARRLLLLPVITTTLGQRWSPPLRLRVAPSLFPRPLSRTLSGCSSACLGPWHSGMPLLGLCCRLLVSPVLGCCLAPLPR